MDLFDCTVIGDVFVDTIVKVNGNYERFFRGGTSYCNFAKALLGGSGNVAAGLSAMGGTPAFVGKAGYDFFGKLYIQDLKEDGVVTKIFLDKHSPTGLIIVLVEDEKQRSFLVFRGANDKLSPAEIDKAVSLIRKSTYLYFSGYSLVVDPQRSAILRAIDLAKKFKSKIIFDPGAFNLVKSEKALFTKLLDSCDVFSPNLAEARAITNVSDTDDVIDKLREKVPLTALRCDENGCILISKENVVRISSYDVECVDPTGAGDAFTAGLIYGLCRGLPLQSIGQLSSWFAAEVITRIGPRSFPTKSKIERFLKRLCARTMANNKSFRRAS
jgi:sugar/nucleoside kinase (ribokinase family)